LKWIALALYAFISAVVTGVGRVGFGVSQALSSRYITISTLFTISAFVITVVWIKQYLRVHKQLPAKWVAVIASISTLLILSYILSGSNGVTQFKERRLQIVERAGGCLENVDMAPEEYLKVLHPMPALVRERTKTLLQLGIGLSNQWVRWDDIQKNDGGLFFIDTINDSICSQQKQPILVNGSKNGIITFTGWAVDEKAEDVAYSVYLTLDGKPIARAEYGLDRRDVAKHFKMDKYRFSGWSASINASGLICGDHKISLRIVSKNKKIYYDPTNGFVLIKVMKDS
jgi:hypothetical protein